MRVRRFPSLKPALCNCDPDQQVGPLSCVVILQMRQSRTKTTPCCLEGRSLHSSLSGEGQVIDQSPLVGEGSRLDKMVRDMSGVLTQRAGVQPLDRVSYCQMQLLLTRRRNP